MSELNDDPGPAPDELRDFLERHRATGEPRPTELGRALLKLHSATRPVAGRRLLSPMVMAVAALLVVTIAGGAIGWRVHEAKAKQTPLAFEKAQAAWRQRDLEAAAAAFEGCDSELCVWTATAVKQAETQLPRLGDLGDAEVDSLRALDTLLGGGSSDLDERGPSPGVPWSLFFLAQGVALHRQGIAAATVDEAIAAFRRGLDLESEDPLGAIASYKTVTTLVGGSTLATTAHQRLDAEARRLSDKGPRTLLVRGREAVSAKQYDLAIGLLSGCLDTWPDNPDCTAALASAHAKRGSEELRDDDNRRARELYERFLIAARPDDERRKQVEEILAAPAPGPRAGEPAPDDAAKSPTNTQDLYLQGYQLKDTNPAEAQRRFQEVVRLTEPGSTIHQKALSRLAELEGPPAKEPGALVIPAGQVKVLHVPGLSRVAVGDVAVADVSTIGNGQLRVRGLLEGQTTLLTWTETGDRRTWLVTVRGSATSSEGRLKLASNPTNAKVIIDGKDTGRTTPVLPGDPITVKPGRHRIEFEFDGRRSAPLEVNVVAGDNRVILGDIPR